MSKPKIAICWLGSCGGCDEAVVDINEVILQVAEGADLVFWPVAMDYKYHHLEAMADGSIALGIVNGNVRNSEQKEVAQLLRKKCSLILAFGACACFGGTPGLANFNSREDIFNWVYRDAPTVVNPSGTYPRPKVKVDGRELTLPEFFSQVSALRQVIDVDYYLPGCPPPPDLVINAVVAVLDGKLPPKGSTLSPHKALCDTCPRNKTKPYKISIKEVKRVHQVEADPDNCFLNQGIICMGPATRSGCGESCLKINLPCRGCFGPIEGVVDSGAKFISALAAMLDSDKESDLTEVLGHIDDPAGYLYRFSLPISLLEKKVV